MKYLILLILFVSCDQVINPSPEPALPEGTTTIITGKFIGTGHPPSSLETVVLKDNEFFNRSDTLDIIMTVKAKIPFHIKREIPVIYKSNNWYYEIQSSR